MKYNLVWDQIVNLNLFPKDFIAAEVESYLPRINTYGLPLDSRGTQTKSDWLVWTATPASDKATFRRFVEPLARYNIHQRIHIIKRLRESSTSALLNGGIFTKNLTIQSDYNKKGS